jgi:hypothetical protein
MGDLSMSVAMVRLKENLMAVGGFLAHPLRASIALGLVVLLAQAARAHHYRVESTTQPAPFLREGREDLTIEPVGVALLGDGRRVLVADEKAAPLHVVDLSTGALVGAPLGSPKFPPTTKNGPNWQGMASDSEGNFYLVGSHSGKGVEERAECGAVIRFRVRDGQAPAIEDSSVIRWDIAGPLEAALRAQGLDEAQVARRRIEGLAIREGGGRRELVIGLREPDDKVRAFAADITTEPSPDSALELRPVFAFDAGSHEGVAAQLTSLEYVPAMGGFLILTSNVGPDHAFHGNSLWYVANGDPRVARRYASLGEGMKAGGLAVLGVKQMGSRTEIKLLITYDNDPYATKIPSRFQTALLVHERN